MTTLVYLFRAEFLKLRTTRTALGLFIAAVVVSVAPVILVMLLVSSGPMIPDVTTVATSGFKAIVPILAVVFGVLGMTNEYRHGTITYTYLTTPKRGVVIIVKLVCYGIVGALVMAAAGIMVGVTFAAIAALRGVTLPWLSVANFTDASTVGVAGLFLVMVGIETAFGVSLGALFRAQIPTIVGIVIWALAVEPIAVGLSSLSTRWQEVGVRLPFAAFGQITAGGALRVGADSGASAALSRPEAFVVAIAYIAVFSIAAVFLSMRRDVT